MKQPEFRTTFPVDITGMMRPEISASGKLETPWEVIIVSFHSEAATVEVTEKDGLTTITVIDSSRRTSERIGMLSEKVSSLKK